jgi:polyhydroxybutyrate depolymerase
LINRLKTMFYVDARRIYASGISNGANTVNYLSCRSSARLIAAVAPVAGPMCGQDDGPCAPPRPVPILDRHSVNDPLVPYGGLPSPPNQYPLLPLLMDNRSLVESAASATERKSPRIDQRWSSVG